LRMGTVHTFKYQAHGDFKYIDTPEELTHLGIFASEAYNPDPRTVNPLSLEQRAGELGIPPEFVQALEGQNAYSRTASVLDVLIEFGNKGRGIIDYVDATGQRVFLGNKQDMLDSK